ncbi:hypothetical protein ANN_08196 [Periplaneta americana]|uniref:Uncharacterized protein n=1 Tax=Periplaneta americana TaxID=6978 RepID=A0ABQ8T0R1_PERAM|nr:hypothetical protein ANN_08196 [Periplaneta americana]
MRTVTILNNVSIAFDTETGRCSETKSHLGMPQESSYALCLTRYERLRWAGHVARMGESRNAYRVLVGRPEGKRPLGRPRRRWEDNIKMDLREVGYDGRDWINLAQDRDQWRAYVRATMNLRNTNTHNAELHALYSSPDIIRNIKSRRLRWAGHVARMSKSRNAYRVLVGRPEGKRPLGRPRRRWEDNIKMDLREVRYDDKDWINLAQDTDQWRAYVRAAMNLRTGTYVKVFENKVLRKIFGAKRDEITGEWRKLYNAELHALYSSPDIIRNIKSRRLRWAGHVARMGESRNAYRVLVGRPEGKRPLGRQRRRWEDNIKMDLREVGYDDRDWINLAQDRDRWRAYVRAAMNLRVP